ncbi:Adenylyltransferase and sulfurtransferase MOCS3 [Quillaja saponaria]|uniref:Adenylyltransferase and sulfurtransferase MOCS3 n=1 Tax=Quillaja saponaria TaxID=32244 RepID=A0AAD7PQ46_QUISA|nr:Adenylyltransferase and sulfurtransferase MOCS3 [Quillaja saponaria]
MESNGGDSETSRIFRDIEALKDTKSLIDHKLSVLEAWLQEISLRDDTVSNGSAPPPASTINLSLVNGLTPDMIYRNSCHLLLPSFGVEDIGQILDSFLITSAEFKSRIIKEVR